ncbi:hypothetical protein UA08_01312 [Talaromyces atroroseus]|uniref:DUF7918 domain-containing protein n=1 Tax=Talaromyces atroroseus TaxID=1441469 RepID=A0A1Q5QB99_TALAT|nr:hypothetical protein UA08_01312 [Talaromyces atroroseus]OKL63215.1 hypothetical protein UA08_01312 [Talaromyces atroroseus]
MPCFKGLAVSIHTPEGPIAEFSVQRQSRQSRIACYIPVPAPKITESGKAESSTFAVSITLLNSGQNVPYSTPKPTPENPNPKPQLVGVNDIDDNGQAHWISPYHPLTGSQNETVAAYIYFDGRQKEEVATLLRRGEETWVNSRWVSVPDSEGGGLAEREFLFREVGLERWLNGLDLEGKDAAAKIERRRQKMEKRRLQREAQESGDMEMDATSSSTKREKGIMRYGDNAKTPLQNLSDDDFSSDSDDDPIPESAGQIKVALFRVLASGEIKRGEYSPQFDAHDDDDEVGGQDGNGGADVDHTTSFAKPKTLDPKTISTQTVTGIDPTDKPYAVFTFMYRGERQLQKMGILKPKTAEDTSVKRKSTDFSKLAPLKPGGAVGFMNYREGESAVTAKTQGKSKKSSESDMDSDEDEDDTVAEKADEDEVNDTSNLSPEDLRRQKDLAEGVRKIKLKRQHSAEQMGDTTSTNTPASGATPPAAQSYESSTPPDTSALAGAGASENPSSLPEDLKNSEYIGSPLKKARASVSTADENGLRKRLGSNLSNNISEVLKTSSGSDPENTDAGKNASFGGSGSHFGGSVNVPPVESMHYQQPDEEEVL